MRYVRVGNQHAKDTVIFMPAPANIIEHMEVLIKMFESNFQLIAFEGIGFGYSRAFLPYDFSLKHNTLP